VIRPINALARVSIDQVLPDPRNPRKSLPDLDELADSITRYGIRQPLTVQAAGRDYLIVDGHRRRAAALLARLPEVPCIVVSARDAGALLLERLLPALHQRQLNPVEEAQSFQALMTMQSWTVDELAQHLSLSRDTVRLRLALLQLPVEAQQLILTGRLTLDEAADLARQVRTAGAGQTTRRVAPPHFTSAHPLAQQVKAACDAAEHPTRGRINRTGCGACWEDAIRQDAAGDLASARAAARSA